MLSFLYSKPARARAEIFYPQFLLKSDGKVLLQVSKLKIIIIIKKGKEKLLFRASCWESIFNCRDTHTVKVTLRTFANVI